MAIAAVSCTTVPFDRPEMASLGGMSPKTVLEHARQTTPARFSLLNSIVFRKAGRALSALGLTTVDQQRDEIAVQALNPVGMTLFSFRDTGGTIQERHVAGFLDQMGDVATAVSRDVRNIYLRRVPGAGAEVRKNDTSIVFEESAGEGTLRYVFAGDGALLVEKCYLEAGRPVWTIGYYEYRHQDGMAYPGGVVLRHHRHRYRLIVRLKEILPSGEERS
jgi:hypothetical protein